MTGAAADAATTAVTVRRTNHAVDQRLLPSLFPVSLKKTVKQVLKQGKLEATAGHNKTAAAAAANAAAHKQASNKSTKRKQRATSAPAAVRRPNALTPAEVEAGQEQEREVHAC